MTYRFENNYLMNSVVPVLIQSQPDKFEEISNWIYSNFDLSKYMSIFNEYSPLFNFTTIPSFNMVSALVSGPSIEIISSDTNVKNVYLNKQKSILQTIFPTVPAEGVYSAPFSISMQRPSQGQTGTVSGKYMYFTSMQWIRTLVGADVANSAGYTGKGVKVGVVDTGASYYGSMVSGKIIKQTAIPPIYTDANGHATWVTSAIVGRTIEDHTFSYINNTPVVNEGIAPSCTLYSIKGLGFVVGTGSDAMLIKGLEIAMQDGVNVVSNSWGGSATNLTSPEDSPYYDVFNTMVNKGIIPLQAAGNSGPESGTIADPGDLPNVLTVGATNVVTNPSPFGQAGTVADFSSRGPAFPNSLNLIKPDFVAPGAIIDNGISGVLSAAYTHWVHSMQAIAGTSMATPIAAGLITLMDQAFNQYMGRYMTINDIHDMFNTLPLNFLDNYEKNNQFGYGFLTWSLFVQYMKMKYDVNL